MEEEVLKRIELLLQSLVKMQAALLERDAFPSGGERVAYELTDSATTKQICKSAHISATTLSNMWTRLEKMGLLKKEGNRYKRVIAD